MNKKCKSCRYFDSNYGLPGKENGACSRLGMNDLIISDALSFSYIAFHKNGNPQHVSVGENFGCILHQEKEDAE